VLSLEGDIERFTVVKLLAGVWIGVLFFVENGINNPKSAKVCKIYPFTFNKLLN